jgi:hypothetical protein
VSGGGGRCHSDGKEKFVFLQPTTPSKTAGSRATVVDGGTRKATRASAPAQKQGCHAATAEPYLTRCSDLRRPELARFSRNLKSRSWSFGQSIAMSHAQVVAVARPVREQGGSTAPA